MSRDARWGSQHGRPCSRGSLANLLALPRPAMKHWRWTEFQRNIRQLAAGVLACRRAARIGEGWPDSVARCGRAPARRVNPVALEADLLGPASQRKRTEPGRGVRARKLGGPLAGISDLDPLGEAQRKSHVLDSQPAHSRAHSRSLAGTNKTYMYIRLRFSSRPRTAGADARSLAAARAVQALTAALVLSLQSRSPDVHSWGEASRGAAVSNDLVAREWGPECQ